MKRWKKILTCALTATMLFGLCGTNSQASGERREAYTYKVTFYAGNQGTFEGTEGLAVSNAAATVEASDDKIVVSGLKAGDTVGLTAQSTVKLDADSKYYAQGIRMSGRDNSTVSAAVFEVNSDMDYVVAYGIKGNQVKYTVNYQDEAGRALAASATFYGNVGDKPVVAYKYIEGYFPKTFGFTKTLVANAAENVFTFVYTDMPQTVINQQIQVETITQVVPGGVTVIGGGAGGNAGGGAGGNAGGGAGAGGNEAAGEGGGNVAPEAGQETEAEAGGDDLIVDLDEEEVPLASEHNAGLDAPMKTYIALISGGVAALVVIAVLLVYLKKKRK